MAVFPSFRALPLKGYNFHLHSSLSLTPCCSSGLPGLGFAPFFVASSSGVLGVLQYSLRSLTSSRLEMHQTHPGSPERSSLPLAIKKRNVKFAPIPTGSAVQQSSTLEHRVGAGDKSRGACVLNGGQIMRLVIPSSLRSDWIS